MIVGPHPQPLSEGEVSDDGVFYVIFLCMQVLPLLWRGLG